MKVGPTTADLAQGSSLSCQTDKVIVVYNLESAVVLAQVAIDDGLAGVIISRNRAIGSARDHSLYSQGWAEWRRRYKKT